MRDDKAELIAIMRSNPSYYDAVYANMPPEVKRFIFSQMIITEPNCGREGVSTPNGSIYWELGEENIAYSRGGERTEEKAEQYSLSELVLSVEIKREGYRPYFMGEGRATLTIASHKIIVNPEATSGEDLFKWVYALDFTNGPLRPVSKTMSKSAQGEVLRMMFNPKTVEAINRLYPGAIDMPAVAPVTMEVDRYYHP